MNYQIGNRVKFITFGAKPSSLEGRVVYIKDGGSIGIEFDFDFDGHNLDHRCKSGHGWWCREDDLRLIEGEGHVEDKPFGLESRTESKFKTMLQNIPRNLKRILSGKLRKQYRAGLIDSQLELTDLGKKEMLEILSQEKVVQEGLTKFADEIIAKAKKEKNETDEVPF